MKMIFEKDQFPWLEGFSNNWQTIKDEMLQLNDDTYKAWPEKRYYNFGWKTFGLYAWGVRLDKHCRLCPETTKLLETVPNLVSAGFSSMQPNTHIKPHKGYPEGILRAHVPLVIPDPSQCALRVGDHIQEWREGEAWVFDDTINHEAWNKTDRVRIVLLIDFRPEDDSICLTVPKYKRRKKGFLASLFSKN